MPQLADEFTSDPDAYRRGTPAYEARLRSIINRPIQGIASGVGSYSTDNPPVLPSWVRQRLAEHERVRAAEQARAEARARDAEEAQARARAEAAARERAAARARAARERASTAEPPPRGTPAYEAYLKEMLNATPQGIAPGYGSFSAATEPARRKPKEPTLGEKLAGGVIADLRGSSPTRATKLAIGALPREPRPRTPEPSGPGMLEEYEVQPTGAYEPRDEPEGPGARMFEMTPDEESLWATPSSEAYIPERLIEIYKRNEFDRADVEFLNGYLPEARRRAAEIANLESPMGWTELGPNAAARLRANDLRAGAPLSGGGWGSAIGQLIGESGAKALDVAVQGGRAVRDAALDLGLAWSDAERQSAQVEWDAQQPLPDFLWDTAKLAARTPKTPIDVALEVYDAYRPEGVGLAAEGLRAMTEAYSDCGSRRIGRGGMVIYEDCRGLAPLLVQGGKGAITLGDTVFSTERRMDALTELEEFYHYYHQYRVEKDRFWPGYVPQHLSKGYDRNPYELEAKHWACNEYIRLYGTDDRWYSKCFDEGRIPASFDDIVDGVKR